MALRRRQRHSKATVPSLNAIYENINQKIEAKPCMASLFVVEILSEQIIDPVATIVAMKAASNWEEGGDLPGGRSIITKRDLTFFSANRD